MSVNFKWLTVFDMKGRFKLTENVPEKDFDISVKDAYDFDVITTLPDSLMDSIKAVLLENPTQWNEEKAYVVGNKINYNGVYYRCLVNNTNSLPSATNTNWGELERMTFWLGYIKPFFECCAYYRFILWHGANVTQYGIRQNNEDTSTEIADKKKGELMADITNKRDVLMARMTKRFNDLDNTLDGVQYEYDSTDVAKPNEGVRIWGQRKVTNKYRKCCDDLNNSTWL